MEKTIQTYDRVVGVGVDLLNDFAPWGALPVAEGDQTVEPFNNAAAWIRANNGVVAFTNDEHPEVTAHFQENGGPWVPHCVKGTEGAKFIAGLVVEDADPILKKGTNPVDDGYSGFEGVGSDGMTLETLVYPEKGKSVAMIIGGLAIDYCDKATALDGIELAKKLPKARKLAVYVLRDAVRAVDVNPGDGDRAIAEMEAAGVIFVNSTDLVNGQVMEVRS